MKDNNYWRVWSIVYPVGIYFVVTNLVMFMLGSVWLMTDENYMIQHIIATAAAFPFLYSFYHRDKRLPGVKAAERKVTARRGLKGAGFALAVALAGVALNNLIGYTGLKETSENYRQVSDAFYGGGLWLSILGSCLLVPLLEELLYRGIVYRRLRAWVGVWPAVVVSALIFGAMHFNLVQFLYAGVIGILLAVTAERAGLAEAMAAHMLTNLISVLRSSTHWFDFMSGSQPAGYIVTAAAAIISAALLWFLWRRDENTI